MAEVSLSRGLVAMVDDADLALVEVHNWHASPSDSRHGGWYAMTSIGGKTAYMHRLIMEAGDMWVDHIDNDGLNNSRSNLRLCTISQNNMNRRPYTRSGLKGVYQNGQFIDGTPRWRVFLDVPGVGRVEGGSFRCQRAAAAKYDELASLHHGEFAHLNLVAA